MEGALGPEYQLASSMHQHGPQRVIVRVAFPHSFSWSYVPLDTVHGVVSELAKHESMQELPTISSGAVDTMLNASKTDVPPPEENCKAVHVWEFEGDISDSTVVEWQVRNINDVIFPR